LNCEVFSIEPLSPEQIQQIEFHTNGIVTILSRDFWSFWELMPQIEVLIARDRDAISQIVNVCPNLKFLFIVSTGVERLPFEQLRERRILVANTGGVNSEIMSNYVMAYILADSARIEENLRNQSIHHWKRYQCVDGLLDKTILIAGAGRVGTLIAKKAECFGMRSIGIKRDVMPVAHFQKVTSLESMCDMLPMADYVVCCLPLTPKTRKIFDVVAFEKMKSSSMFINVSRGACVNEHDLMDALKKSKIRRAVLDVFGNEPLTPDSPLWDIPNLWLSPHSSGRLENFMDEAIQYFVENYLAYKNQKELPNRVDLVNGY